MLVFVDLEASSLDPDGWPVEVGLARREGGHTLVGARLIRPEAGWPMSAWSPESAAVHNIPLAELRCADPAPAVARWVIEETAGRRLVSDAPAFDGRWLSRLLVTLGPDVPTPRILDFDVLVATHLDLQGAMRAYGHLDAHPAPHRAGPDAERLLRAWLAGRGVKR